jgi:hypothetical protein
MIVDSLCSRPSGEGAMIVPELPAIDCAYCEDELQEYNIYRIVYRQMSGTAMGSTGNGIMESSTFIKVLNFLIYAFRITK